MSPNSRSHDFLMYFVRYHNLIIFRVQCAKHFARRKKCVSAIAGARFIFRVQNYTLSVNVAILKNYDFIFAPNATTILCHQNCMNTVTLPHRSSCVSGNGDIIEAVEGNPMASVYFTSSRRRPLT